VSIKKGIDFMINNQVFRELKKIAKSENSGVLSQEVNRVARAIALLALLLLEMDSR
jgi:rRNA-processing protein FCF1